MLVDLRTYRCRPGTINAHLALYDEHGKVPQYRCLGQPLAFLRGESGDPNEFVHIWLYKNAGDREEKGPNYGPTQNGWPMFRKVLSLGHLNASRINL